MSGDFEEIKPPDWLRTTDCSISFGHIAAKNLDPELIKKIEDQGKELARLKTMVYQLFYPHGPGPKE